MESKRRMLCRRKERKGTENEGYGREFGHCEGWAARCKRGVCEWVWAAGCREKFWKSPLLPEGWFWNAAASLTIELRGAYQSTLFEANDWGAPTDCPIKATIQQRRENALDVT